MLVCGVVWCGVLVCVVVWCGVLVCLCVCLCVSVCCVVLCCVVLCCVVLCCVVSFLYCFLPCSTAVRHFFSRRHVQLSTHLVNRHNILPSFSTSQYLSFKF